MKEQVRLSGRLLIQLESLLNSLRGCFEKYHLMSLIRTLRPIIHFGPWRGIAKFVIRQLRPVKQSVDEDNDSLFASLDTNAIVEEVRQNSFAIAGVLPADFVSRVRAVTDHLPVDDYKHMYYIDENVRRIADDPAIKNVLRAYFKCEPVLLESTMVVTRPAKSNVLIGQNLFHFDYAGWESLNVFVYLTDVTIESSCHIVVKGSHRAIGLRDIFRRILTPEEARREFGSSIQNITGPAGTLFFENTEAYHRRHCGNSRRVMMNLLFASHRSWFSYGRASCEEIKKRTEVYERLRVLN